ncbi:MAG: sugar ABC transporter ATP-binding protein [Clostridia bacterium]|nr:sugar ABC transporter ATP-binding protein [Clostridia bacterium]
MGAECVLEFKNITKRYGTNTVLHDVSLSVKPGEIHALLGENGAGKSTLMNVLFGMPVIHESGGFSGEVFIDGNSVVVMSPHDAMAKGIGMVHQEFMLIPGFSITENIKLNREITHRNPVSAVLGDNLELMDMPAMRRDARKALDSVGMKSLDELALVKGLPVGYMQFVEIAREIDKTGIKILVFDEPTAVLTESEAKLLMEVMRSIAESGIAIIFITHRLDEVLTVADTVTVLRDGKLAATRQVQETSLIELASLMIGRTGSESVVDLPPREEALTGKIALKANDLFVEMPGEMVKGASFEVREGEIFGIGGLAGQGKVGIPNGILGTFPASGQVELFGEPLPLNDVRATLSKGVAMLSEDRRGVGLLLDQSIEDNIVFSAMQVHRRFLKGLLPRVKAAPPGKVLRSAVWALSVVLVLAGFFGLTRYQLAFNRSAAVKAYIAFQKQATAVVGEADIIIEDTASSADDVVLPSGGAAAALEEEEAEPVVSVFLSEKAADTLTPGEKILLFFANSAWAFLAAGLLLAAAMYAYQCMIKGSVTLKDTSGIRALSKQMIHDLDIRCTGSGQLVGTLSGGNQQKVCIARVLALTPKFLFVSEPTRGIDIGAKRLVLETLVRLNREQKLTIVMVSSELLELRSICDRIAIVAGGKVAGVFEPNANDADIGLAMSGITPERSGAV